jgi:hypothetical protein
MNFKGVGTISTVIIPEETGGLTLYFHAKESAQAGRIKSV